MNKSNSAISQLMIDASNPKIGVSELLRKAKIIASKLKQPEFLNWIDKELNGYKDISADDLPIARKFQGQLEALVEYQGWQPVNFGDAETKELLSSVPMFDSIGSLESLATRADEKSAALIKKYGPIQEKIIRELVPEAHDFRSKLAVSQVHGLLDFVRNSLLHWALKLEEAGITGSNLNFSFSEKEEAKSVTQNIIAQNIGLVGSTHGNSIVTNNQTAEFEFEKVTNLVAEIEKYLPMMSEELQIHIKKDVAAIKSELQKPLEDRKSGLLHNTLNSIKTVCEGSAGNLIAEGIIRLISNL